MHDAEILADLGSIFRDVLDDDELVLTVEMTAEDVEDWDSISHIQVLVVVQDFFHIRLRTGEVAALATVGDLVDLIARRRSEP